MTPKPENTKRGYDLRKRLVNMDQTRLKVLNEAQQQLETLGYRGMSMASLAAGSGITRQTVHNLFGSKSNVIEALFDAIALDGGMERMRDVMSQTKPERMLQEFVQLFCGFWRSNRLLFRRIHGIGAIEPDFGQILQARNQRRQGAALRIAKQFKQGHEAEGAAAAIAALTSFEFYDALVEYGRSEQEAEAAILKLAATALRT